MVSKNNKHGKPYICLHKKAKNILEKENSKFKIDISLSDERDFAIANVIISNEI